ncbi:ribosome recycling factor [Mycoplasmopsis gallinarum]
MNLEEYLLEFDDEASKVLNHFVFELSRISTGRANPQLIKNIKINYYDTLTPLEELANVSVPEAQQLLIKPYDTSVNKEIAKALTNANLSVGIADEGHQVRLTFPALTTERKKELVKGLKKHTEAAKVGIRNVRQEINKKIKANEEISEDMQKHFLNEIQKEVDSKIQHIDDLTSAKEKDIMAI